MNRPQCKSQRIPAIKIQVTGRERETETERETEREEREISQNRMEKMLVWEETTNYKIRP
jgi:hypothetical protein